MTGGLEWYIYNMSKHLINRGHEAHVFVTNSRLNALPENEIIDGIQVHRLPLYVDLSYRVKIWKDLKSRLISGNFDVIHAYDYAAHHSLVAALVAKACEIPIVLTIMDLHSLIPRKFWKHVPILIFEKGFAGFIMNLFDKVLVRAPELIIALTKIGVHLDKIIVTPSGIDKRFLEPADGTPFRSKHALSGKIIFFMGRIHPVKGLHTLLLAMPKITPQVKDVKLVIAGPDQIGYKKELIQLAKSLAIMDSILFLDPIQDLEEKAQAYAACNVFVLPSLFEGTSQAIFDAMAQGKPIVATACGGIPSQIMNGVEGLLIPPNDPEKLGDSVIRLLSDPELATKLADEAKRKAHSFTYDRLSKQMEAIYQDLIAS